MLSIHIGIGSTNLSKPIISYIVYDYIIHPEYDNETKHHDISLVQLPEKIEFGRKYFRNLLSFKNYNATEFTKPTRHSSISLFTSLFRSPVELC